MKKLLMLMLILSLVLLSTVAGFATESTVTRVDGEGTVIITNTSDKLVFDAINNIQDDSRRDIIFELFTTPAYGVVIASTDKKNYIPDFTDAEKCIAMVDSLSQMSDKKLDKAIEKIVNDTVQKNKNNPNVVWDKSFKDKYVKKYAPNDAAQLKTTLTATDLKNMKEATLAAASTEEFQYYYLKKDANDDLMFGLGVNVEFGYDGTDVLSLYPSTVSFETSAWHYKGLVNAESGEGIAYDGHGWVTKVGKFSGPWPVPITTAKLKLDVDCFGDGSWDGDWYLDYELL